MNLNCLVPILLLLTMALGYAGVVVWILGPRGETTALARGLGWKEARRAEGTDQIGPDQLKLRSR